MQSVSCAKSLSEWFYTSLRDMECRDDTRAYVVNVLARPLPNAGQQSVVLSYAFARQTNSFAAHQRVGDWVLWAEIFDPKILSENSDIARAAAQMSYYACYRFLGRKWQLYEQLADEFHDVVMNAQRCLSKTR